jgi:transposase
VAVGGAQRPKHLPNPALADADQAGEVGGGQPLAALHLAHLCGVSPIPASSGRTDRHRLNRAGDRRANNALWRIALVRMHCHPPTRAYVERRTKQGLSKLDIMGCLKRYIAREIYQHLTSPPPTAPPACLK